MKAFIAFTKKEFTESLRTYKLMILLAVFLLFGLMNPLIAKLTPDLLKILETQDISIQLPEPTALDSWVQFYKNVGQMGMLVLAIIFAGIMANEFSHGTLINILTKGMKRHTIVLSKFISAVGLWTLAYLICFAVTYSYTEFFWDTSGLNYCFAAFSGLWIFGVLLISLLIFGGILFKTFIGSLLLCGGAVVTMALINIIPKAQKYNPILLAGDNTALLTAQKAISEVIPAIITCTALILLVMIGSVMVFNKKQV